MPNAWKHQKAKLAERYNPTPEDIRNIIYAIKDPRDQFFVCLSYLTGARVQEVIAVRREDITLGEKKGIRVLLVQMKNEKNKKKKEKLIPIRLDLEGDLGGIIIRYVEGKTPSQMTSLGPENTTSGGSLLGFKSRQRGWQIFKKYHLNPHFMRHTRATHKATYFGYKTYQMLQFFGWADIRSSTGYVHLNWEDLI